MSNYYSALENSDFEGLGEDYANIPLARRIISKKVLEMAVNPQGIKNIEHQNALKQIEEAFPNIPLDLVHWDEEHNSSEVVTTYYIKAVKP